MRVCVFECLSFLATKQQNFYLETFLKMTKFVNKRKNNHMSK